MNAPPDPDLAARLAAALDAVKPAAAETLRWFISADLTVTEKPDHSPVTQADLAAEAILKEHLLGAFPHDSFLGEESGHTDGTSGYEWIVDPIDGTKSFVRGVPLYATLIGCRREGRGVLGVIAIPSLDEVAYASAGGGAWHRRGGSSPQPARVSSRATLGEALLCSSDFTSFAKRRDAAAGDMARQQLEAACGLVRSWGDGYGYLLVATGRAEVMADPLLNEWDAAAVETVITEAGGRFTDWQGRPRIDSGDGLATNGLVHDAALGLLANAG